MSCFFFSLIGKTNPVLQCFPYRNVLGNKGRKLEFHVLVSPLEVPEEMLLCSGGRRALVMDGDRKTDPYLRTWQRTTTNNNNNNKTPKDKGKKVVPWRASRARPGVRRHPEALTWYSKSVSSCDIMRYFNTGLSTSIGICRGLGQGRGLSSKSWSVQSPRNLQPGKKSHEQESWIWVRGNRMYLWWIIHPYGFIGLWGCGDGRVPTYFINIVQERMALVAF